MYMGIDLAMYLTRDAYSCCLMMDGPALLAHTWNDMLLLIRTTTVQAEKSMREASSMPASQRSSSQEQLQRGYGTTPTYGTNNAPSNRAR